LSNLLSDNTVFELLIKLQLYHSDKGRHGFISDNYRPKIYFSIDNQYLQSNSSDCVFQLINQNKIEPGQSAIVLVKLLRFRLLIGLINESTNFIIKEGNRAVGEGKVFRLIGEKVGLY
jgi:translation elongation factor EF-Tu-like GTPase